MCLVIHLYWVLLPESPTWHLSRPQRAHHWLLHAAFLWVLLSGFLHLGYLKIQLHSSTSIKQYIYQCNPIYFPFFETVKNFCAVPFLPFSFLLILSMGINLFTLAPLCYIFGIWEGRKVNFQPINWETEGFTDFITILNNSVMIIFMHKSASPEIFLRWISGSICTGSNYTNFFMALDIHSEIFLFKICTNMFLVGYSIKDGSSYPRGAQIRSESSHVGILSQFLWKTWPVL